MKQSMHAHSLEAWRSGRLSIFNHREVEVLRALEKLGAATDREIMVSLGKLDPNYVRPRVTELIKSGLLEESGECRDPHSGKMVRRVRIALEVRRPEPIAAVPMVQVALL